MAECPLFDMRLADFFKQNKMGRAAACFFIDCQLLDDFGRLKIDLHRRKMRLDDRKIVRRQKPHCMREAGF